MEARKITIISTKTQSKKVIMSEAETLGQLKMDLDKEGIDYEDMDFIEGVSQTEPKTDGAILPRDVPYTNRTTGETKITNELVFMLTNTKKKIKSGMMSRAEMFNYIKSNDLKDVVKESFGKDYTRVSNVELEKFITNLKSSETTEYSVEDLIEEITRVLEKAKKHSSNNKKELMSSYDETELNEMFDNI